MAKKLPKELRLRFDDGTCLVVADFKCPDCGKEYSDVVFARGVPDVCECGCEIDKSRWMRSGLEDCYEDDRK